jgi:hypothetical protein
MFAMQDQQPTTVKVVNPGVAISADDDSGSHRARPAEHKQGPGRKKIADGQIEIVCQEVFGQRMLDGEKEIALHAEAAALVMKGWGATLSRTTFQTYMKPFKRKLPENMPEMAAE